MIVQCPYCNTRYQLPEERFHLPNPMLKCSRCRRVFPAPGAKKPATAKPKKALPPEEESLTLPFETHSWKDDDEPSAPSADDREGFVLGTEAELETAGDDAASDEPAPADSDVEIVADEPSVDESVPDLSFAEEEDEIVATPAAPPSRDRFVVRALVAFLGVVLAAYGLLTRALLADPVLAERLLGPVPIIGIDGSDRLLAQDVALVGVEGKFQRIKDGDEVFVISGEAVSAARVALQNVEIRGRLFDAEGAMVAEKTIYCGNAVSAKILADLTPREVSVLQKMAPPDQFGIKPGETAAFVLVFMDPPKNAVELSAQVVSASPQA